MTEPSLTRQQQKCLTVFERLEKKGISPTITEIAEAMKVCRSTAYEHLGQLVTKGYIKEGRPESSRRWSTTSKARWPEIVKRLKAGDVDGAKQLAQEIE